VYTPPLDIIGIVIPVVLRLLRVDLSVDTSFAGQRHDSSLRKLRRLKQHTEFRAELGRRGVW